MDVRLTVKAMIFALDAQGLTPETRYELTLMEGDLPLTDVWPLSTMPDPESSSEHLRLLIFTCAGGHPLMSEGYQSFFCLKALVEDYFSAGCPLSRTR